MQKNVNARAGILSQGDLLGSNSILHTIGARPEAQGAFEMEAG